MTSKSFTINIINDNTIECDEKFKVMLTTGTCGINVGRTNSTEVIIKDDDGREMLISDCVHYLCVYTDQQKQCCHLISHNILLKKICHYQLV